MSTSSSFSRDVWAEIAQLTGIPQEVIALLLEQEKSMSRAEVVTALQLLQESPCRLNEAAIKKALWNAASFSHTECDKMETVEELVPAIKEWLSLFCGEWSWLPSVLRKALSFSKTFSHLELLRTAVGEEEFAQKEIDSAWDKLALSAANEANDREELEELAKKARPGSEAAAVIEGKLLEKFNQEFRLASTVKEKAEAISHIPAGAVGEVTVGAIQALADQLAKQG